MDTDNNYPLVFTGRSGEYFRIWIVNVALSLLTLGIYSAWAKVRTKRWFYGHTLLDNNAFSYMAQPMQILKGRIIAVAILFLYYVTSQSAPLLAGIIMILIGIASPWIIVMALRFNARQSAYRGLRLNFTGTVSQAAIVYLLLPIISFVTLGLALPYTAYRQVKFLASNYTYGQTSTLYSGALKPFWSVYLIALLLLFIPFGIIGYGVYSAAQLAALGLPKEIIIASTASIIVVGVVIFYLTIPILSAYIQARRANLFYNHLELGNIRFVSTQRARDLIWIYLSNLVLIALTLGLFIPFARVRLARYRIDHLRLFGTNLDEFAAQARENISAAGSEISDLFDMEIGIA